ncbi:Transcriptional regulator, LysR family protein [Vibrio coralliirubri]|uniref:LysR family transcriptional regulator n=1 Tax=Vibrio coralliirubri TaxID=1516159 RepID=UPI0006390576|nr:LysR family transcriptional regulator [Vibrio coralliirubri]CDT82981.1 Transcriptional regulator, LysR family protein [Vibrio coralliirubri]
MKESEMLRLDFNSLKLLKILGEEKNTKRTGERLFISQPAVSKSLRKLREQFNDQLFLRQKHGLEPTPKCEELLLQLPDVLARLEAIFEQGSSFNPQEYTGEISIHINTVLCYPVMSPLLRMLTQSAPNATINIQNWSHDTELKIKTNQVDLGINFMPLNITKEIIQQHVAPAKFMLCCSAHHPMSKKGSITPEDVGSMPLALMLMPDYHKGDTFAETYLRARNIEPKVLLRTDKIDLCYQAVTDHHCLFPVSHIVRHSTPDDMVLLDIAHFEEGPDFSIGGFYAHRSRHSPYLTWLKELVFDTIKGLS